MENAKEVAGGPVTGPLAPQARGPVISNQVISIIMYFKALKWVSRLGITCFTIKNNRIRMKMKTTMY